MKYNGTIVLHPRIKVFVTDIFQKFFEAVADNTNCKLLYTDKPKRSDLEGSYVVLYNMPHVDYPKISCNLSGIINSDLKLILMYRDMHGQGHEYLNLMNTMLNRADFVFVNQFSFYVRHFTKTPTIPIPFPMCFGPEERYRQFDLELSLDKRIPRCLVPGMVSPSIYPLRHLAWSLNETDVMKHSGYENRKGLTGKKWVGALHLYACCLTDCSKYKYFLGKHIEIPATGSLLLSDSCEELEINGFYGGYNYVEVNEKNYKDVIKDVLDNPASYQKIADMGREHVWKKHKLSDRVNTFSKFLNNMK